MHKSNQRFLNNRLFQYMLPGFIMAVSLHLWKVVDTILTGIMDGTHAMSAVVLSLPMETLIQIPGFCLGVGGSVVAGRLLGSRNNRGASQVMTFTMLVALVIGLMFAAASFFVAGPIAHFLSGGGELYEDTYSFIFLNMLGAPVIGLGILTTSYIGIEKGDHVATAYLITANLMNFVLDFLLLKYTDLGVRGAAFATIFGFLFTLVVFAPYLNAPDLKLKLAKPDKTIPFDLIMRVSRNAVGEMSLDFISELGLNLVIIYMIGSWGMPVFAICRNILLLVGIMISGCISIAPSLGKVMRREYDYLGVRRLCRKTITIIAIGCAVLLVLMFIFADELVDIYAIEGETFEPLTDYMASVIYIFILCLPAYAWNRYFSAYYESLGKKKLSRFISFLTGGVLMIPTVIIGVYIGRALGGQGLHGLALGYVISELAIVIASVLYRRLKMKNKTMLMLPEENPGVCLDLSIKAEMEDTPQIPEKIMAFLKENNIKKRICMFAAVAAEEMTVNSIKFGGKASKWVDICVVINDNKLILRVRDKGVPFNPTEYEFDGDKFDISGIQLVKLISTHISYMRFANMNNTVIEFNDIR